MSQDAPIGGAAELRALGLPGAEYVPVTTRWGLPPDPLGVVAEFAELGIPAMTVRLPGSGQARKEAWAPDWAVALRQAEPIGEEFRYEALRRAANDVEFQAAVSAIYRLGGLGAVANYIMGLP